MPVIELDPATARFVSRPLYYEAPWVPEVAAPTVVPVAPTVAPSPANTMLYVGIVLLAATAAGGAWWYDKGRKRRR
jgi:hypothetical protein